MKTRSIALIVVALATGTWACDDGGNDSPDTAVADSSAPDATAPETSEPDAVADSSAPDAATPDGLVDTSVPVDTAPPVDMRMAIDPIVPSSTGTCPTFENGFNTFDPEGISPRNVLVFSTPEALQTPGPILIYWHGLGSMPLEAEFVLGTSVIDTINSEGGIVVAPTSDATSGNFPWFLTAGGSDETDLVLADEIVACANEMGALDVRHIHTLGMSAGGLQTSQMSYRRSNYLASVIVFSGGFISLLGIPPDQRPENDFMAMVYHGGPTDTYQTLDFVETSTDYANDMEDGNRPIIWCNHNGGHWPPENEGLSHWQFFKDNGFDEMQSPWRFSIPDAAPDYCVYY